MGVWTTLREMGARALLGERFQELELARAAVLRAVDMQPARVTEMDVREMDSRLANLILRHARDHPLGGVGVLDNGELDHRLRIRIIEQSRRTYRADPATRRAVNAMTQFAFAKSVEITARDKAADVEWTAFEQDPANARYMQPHRFARLSRWLLVDGEFFPLFFIDKTTGKCTIRRLRPEQVVDIITDPEDEDTVLFYERQYTAPGETTPRRVYYPDALAKRYLEDHLDAYPLPPGVVRADRDAGHRLTDVCTFCIAYEPVGHRGVPLMYSGAPWAYAYKEFLEDRATLAKAVASVVDTVTTRGGSRAVDMMRQRLGAVPGVGRDESGGAAPGGIAGSIWIGNEMQRRQRMPLGTAASDAKIDGEALLNQAGMGAGLTPAYFGRGELEAMTPAEQKVFEDYRTLWHGGFGDIAAVVFWGLSTYGGSTFQDERVDVSSDDLDKTNLRELATAVSLFTDRRLIPHRTAMRKVLQALDVENAQELVMEYGDQLEAEFQQIFQTQPSDSEPVKRDSSGDGVGKRAGGQGQQGPNDKAAAVGSRPGAKTRNMNRLL